MNTSMLRRCLVALAFSIVATLGACVPTGGQVVGDLRIEQPWVRATPPGAAVSGGFVTIRNLGDHDDRLVSVTSSAVARVEIHQMREEAGLMKMRQLTAGLPIPAGAAVSLQPGGYHLMLIGPKQPFAGGDVVIATLHFERAGDAEVAFQVRGLPGAAESGHAHQH